MSVMNSRRAATPSLAAAIRSLQTSTEKGRRAGTGDFPGNPG